MDIVLAKYVLGIVAIAMTFIGYVPYLRDTYAGKTKPHIYSWLLWTVVTAIAFGLQVTGGAGLGSYVTLSASIMCGVVLLLSLRLKGKRDITTSDKIFLLLAFLSLFLWLGAKQPVASTVLTTLTDLLGFVPTIRKSWNNPRSETISFYSINSVRFTMAVISLQSYTIVTALYPVCWLLGNGLFAIMLHMRRRQVKS